MYAPRRGGQGPRGGGRARASGPGRATPISVRRAGAPLIRISVRFTAGQYSARPWGARGGDGGHEWPPSPFRIVRAATAAWKYNLPDIAEERVHAAVRRLASELPVFCLPRAGRIAGRGAAKGGAPPAPWRIDPREVLHVVWQGAALSAGEEATLSAILARVPYLGRTDSWCEMRLDGGAEAGGAAACRVNCRPYVHGREAGPGAVPARVIVPRPDVTMDDVYRSDAPSDRERARACPDGAKAVPYLIDGAAASPYAIEE